MKNCLSKLSKNPSHKLDMLVAYTHALTTYDACMYDNEGGMGELVWGLANAWRLLSKHGDVALGWDVKYTKPGVLELLEGFKTQVEDMNECYDLGEFVYE